MAPDSDPDTPASNAPTRRADEAEMPDGDTADSPRRHSVGDVIGERYRIESVLGEGAMGTVYLAEHTAMRKTVAVKSLHHRFTRRDEYLERFRREAQAAGNIQHQNICQATDFIDAREQNGGDTAGPVYLVMEYLQGRTLTEVIEADGPLAPHRAVDFALQILDGLEAAHQAGVVHRDLKPDNIMLVVNDGDNDDQASGPIIKLMDFGIARVRMDDDAETLTRAGEVYGTPHYMSPEQAAGDEIDRRTDLYATGVILFEMLTGRPPYDADRMTKVISKHITEPVPNLADASPYQLSEDLQSFISTLMAKNAGDRFDRASSARDALASLDPEGRSTTTLNRVTDSVRNFVSAVTSDDSSDGESSDATPVISRATDALQTTRAQTGHILRRSGRLLFQSLSELVGNYRALDPSARTTLRRGLGTVLLLAIVSAGVLGFFWMRPNAPDPSPIGEQLEKRRQTFASDNGVDLGNNGELDRVEVAGTLDALPDSPTNAHAAYLRGRAFALRGADEQALEAYKTALDANSAYFADENILDDVLDMSRGDGDFADRAESLIASYISNRYLLGHLGRMAFLSDSDRRHQTAVTLLERHGGLSDLPDWMRKSIAMRRASGCDAWKQQIAQLVSTGDPRAAQILEWYADKPRRGCGFLNSKDCYACIRQQLDEAIETLRG